MRTALLAFATALATGTALAQSPPALPPPQDAPAPEGRPVSRFQPPAEPPAEPIPPPEATPPAAQPPTVEPTKPPRDPNAPLTPGSDSMEYLLWWVKRSPLPPLAVRNRNGTPLLNTSGSTTVLGGSPVDNSDRSGGRFMLSTFDANVETDGNPHRIGLEGGYFFLGSRTTTLTAGDSGGVNSAALGRPYRDVTSDREAVLPIAMPGQLAGDLSAGLTTRVQGAELNFVGNLLGRNGAQLDGLIGFRYLEVDEGITLAQRGTLLPFDPAVGPTRFDAVDQFDGHNRFYGGQVGLRGDLRRGPVFVDLAAKVAFGQSNEVVRINGFTRTLPPGRPPQFADGGVLALPTNSGRYPHSVFAVVPEGVVRVGYQFKDRSRLFVGYDFLYLSDVARPGDQIDRGLNPLQIPLASSGRVPLSGPERPQFMLHRSDFWAQGLTIGCEWRY
jgi:hypothetical protein